MIEYRKGNLLTSDYPAIAHGVNCRGVMGAGIAKQIRGKYPQMYDIYRGRCARGGLQLGEIMPWYPGQHRVIYNLATQDYPGPNAEPWAVATSIGAMVLDAVGTSIPSIAMPWIGCGIGGMSFGSLQDILRPYHSAPVNLIVVEYDGS